MSILRPASLQRNLAKRLKRREIYNRWVSKHRKEYIASRIAWRKADREKYPDHYRQKQKEYQDKNREKVREWNRKYKALHPEKIREAGKRYYWKNRRINNAKNIAYNQRLKKEMVEAYGGCCQCCGESRIAFMSLEHLFGDRKLEGDGNTNVYSLYRRLRKMGWPKDRYTCLCINCNFARRHRGACPHQLEGTSMMAADLQISGKKAKDNGDD